MRRHCSRGPSEPTNQTNGKDLQAPTPVGNVLAATSLPEQDLRGLGLFAETMKALNPLGLQPVPLCPPQKQHPNPFSVPIGIGLIVRQESHIRYNWLASQLG
jgi:hypothetical protein